MLYSPPTGPSGRGWGLLHPISSTYEYTGVRGGLRLARIPDTVENLMVSGDPF